MQTAQRIVAARIVGTFGLRGEVKCLATRTGEGALVAGRTFALGSADEAPTVTVAGMRRHHGRLLLQFTGIASETAARALVGRELYVDRASVALADDEYLDADLIGLIVIDDRGSELGRVKRVEHYPAQDMIVVGEREAMIPLVRQFVRAIDLRVGTIAVARLPEGLLDPSAAEEA